MNKGDTLENMYLTGQSIRPQSKAWSSLSAFFCHVVWPFYVAVVVLGITIMVILTLCMLPDVSRYVGTSIRAFNDGLNGVSAAPLPHHLVDNNISNCTQPDCFTSNDQLVAHLTALANEIPCVFHPTKADCASAHHKTENGPHCAWVKIGTFEYCHSVERVFAIYAKYAEVVVTIPVPEKPKQSEKDIGHGNEEEL